MRYCACGCGNTIEIKIHHKYYGIPKFLVGHNSRTTEARNSSSKRRKGVPSWNKGKSQYKNYSHVTYCLCGCGQKIEVQKYHAWRGIPKYKQGHFSKGKTGRVLSEEHKEKIGRANSKPRKSKYPDIIIKDKYCQCGCGLLILIKKHHKYSKIPDYIHGHSWRGLKHSEDTKQKLRELRSKQKLPVKETKIELKLQQALKCSGIHYECGKTIFIKEEKCLTHPDIFIEPNICVYADGDYWHKRPSVIERDKKINKVLAKFGYIVIRFWEKDIHNNIDKCLADLKEVARYSTTDFNYL